MRVRAVLLCVGLAALTFAMPGARATHSASSSWIVTLQPGVDPAAVAAGLAAGAGGSVGHVYGSVLGGFSFTGSSLAADLLRASPLVSSVVADGPVHLAQTSAQVLPTGVDRIDAEASAAGGARGAGVTVAVVDSGIDLLHPDLMANLHPTLGKNCSQPLVPPQDDNSHGTHVAGTIAAADNGVGVVGVAPEATLVPVKAFDAAGESTWSIVICGLDYVAANAAEIDVVNMSFGDLSGLPTACDGVTTSDIDALRQAVCDVVAAGVVPVAAAGNNALDVSGFVPAAFPEVITVSAYSDFDGAPGGAGGCLFAGQLCDDSFANLFSNYGARIDVTAPGFEILSTMPGGLYGLKEGTSMAAPHVSGLVAAMLGAGVVADVGALRSQLQSTGECPDGSAAGADASCAGQGAWLHDPDAEAEPLVDAVGAVTVVPVDEPPAASVVVPSTASGPVVVGVSAVDDLDAPGSLAVAVSVDGGLLQPASWNAASGRYEWTWDTRAVANGVHAVSAQAVDSAGGVGTAPAVSVTVSNLMHVGDLDGVVVLSKRSWKAKVTVVVHSPTEGLLDGAVVSFAWSGGASGTASCTTSRKGVCSVTSGSAPLSEGSVTATVTGVSRSGQTYTAGTNHDADGDSTGTVVVVTR